MSFLSAALVLWFYMSLWFLISLFLRRNDFADVAWGGGFLLLSIIGFSKNPSPSPPLFVFNLSVWLWAWRLAVFIFIRNRKKSEDFRYKAWRDTWKFFYLRSYFQVYLLQGFFLYLICLPILKTNASSSAEFSFIFFVGFLLWIFGLSFEAVADTQMLIFKGKKENIGRIIQEGLWAYSRHPNYFGEVTLWWGIFMMAISFEFHFYYIISPLTITLLILFVSGIPMLEKKYEGRADFEVYKSKTSAFIPWFRK